MKKKVWSYFFLFTLLSFQTVSFVLAAETAQDILKKIKVPNSNWALNKAKPDDKDELALSVTKEGGSVGIRIMVREYPGSSEEYLNMVRGILLKNPSYVGAKASPVSKQQIEGKSWDVCTFENPSKLYQELVARKIGSFIVYSIYTATNGRGASYRPDMLSILGQI